MDEALNLSLVPPELHARALRALTERDALRFIGLVNNEDALMLVCCNIAPLRARAIYEPALLDALVDTRVNHRQWPLNELRFMLEQADRDRLRAAGDPLPEGDPVCLYRGVAGVGRQRRERGLHWTTSLARAVWFARRLDWLEDPAVYAADVPRSALLACVLDRSEAECLADLPRSVGIRRLSEPAILAVLTDKTRRMTAEEIAKALARLAPEEK